MIFTNIEKWFKVIDQSASILQAELQTSYLEAVSHTGDNIFEGSIMQDEILHNDLICKRLTNEYASIKLDELSNEEIRKGFQLAILKGMKEATQSHHQMTPDAVALFISYLVEKMTRDLTELTVLDPAVGTANLLTAVINHLPGKQIDSYGVEVDDLLIKLAFINANLQKQQVELFNRDALQDLFIDPVDLVICDLPVGYYPNDDRADKFQLKSEEGHSFAHHLFIEQSFHHTKPGGKLLFVIPNNLFESKEAPMLHNFLKEHGVIQGLLQLPLSMFKDEKHAKSIFLVQKKGPDVKIPKQALLAELPSFSNKKAMEGMIQRIDHWFQSEF